MHINIRHTKQHQNQCFQTVESKTRPDPNKVNQTPQTPTPATDLHDSSCTSICAHERKHSWKTAKLFACKPTCGSTKAPNTAMPSGLFFRVWRRIAHSLRQSVRLDEVCNVGGKLLDDCVVETLDVLEHALVVLQGVKMGNAMGLVMHYRRVLSYKSISVCGAASQIKRQAQQSINDVTMKQQSNASESTPASPFQLKVTATVPSSKQIQQGNEQRHYLLIPTHVSRRTRHCVSGSTDT